MAALFGFSVGDFIAVGKIIKGIVTELRENGEAAPEYQHLLIELEALDRALKQIESLQPGRHELLQLTAIRATALACQQPLQQFLDKISKFDPRLGAANASDQRFRGFHRRIQWRLAYKDDVKELRMKLRSHVATITLLLMTQTVSSITRADHDRADLACELKDKILAHRRLLEEVQCGVDSTSSQQVEMKMRLEGVKSGIDSSLAQQMEMKVELENHADKIVSLDRKADQAIDQIQTQRSLLQELDMKVSTNSEGINSCLATATQTLSKILAGLLTLRDIATKLCDLIVSIGKFRAEMRESVGLLLHQFSDIYQSLRRLETYIPKKIDFPIVKFTDALGKTHLLPYQTCIKWEAFRLMLSALFVDHPARFRVDKGQFLIAHAVGGRLLRESSWRHAIQEGDHLQMSMTLDDLFAQDDVCPFPSCKASLQNTEMSNGGKTCPACNRWIRLVKLESPSIIGPTTSSKPILGPVLRPTPRRLPGNEFSGGERSSSSRTPASLLVEDVEATEDGEMEDIELYRNINVIFGARARRMVFRLVASMMEIELQFNMNCLLLFHRKSVLRELHSGSVIKVREVLFAIHRDRGNSKMLLLFMARLNPFIDAMDQFDEAVELFMNARTVTGLVWGAMKKLILQYAKSHWDTFGIAQSGDTFDTILNAYMQLGEHMPKLRKHRFQFQTQPQMTNILVLIYGNILKYHRNVLFTYRKFCDDRYSRKWLVKPEEAIKSLEEILISLDRHKDLLVRGLEV